MEYSMYLEFKRFCNIFHIFANYMEGYVGDLFIDLPRAFDKYLTEGEMTYCIRKTGGDILDRFTTILMEGNEPHSEDDALRYAMSTLGVDVAFKITPSEVIVTNIKLPDYSERDIVNRLKDYVNVSVKKYSLA